MSFLWEWIAANTLYAAGFVLALTIVGGLLLDLGRKRVKDEQTESKEVMEQRIEDREERLAQKKKDLALSCEKCDKLAEPINGTGNRYRCEHCSNQFAGAHHGM